MLNSTLYINLVVSLMSQLFTPNYYSTPVYLTQNVNNFQGSSTSTAADL